LPRTQSHPPRSSRLFSAPPLPGIPPNRPSNRR
jgi:hypothetical protein